MSVAWATGSSLPSLLIVKSPTASARPSFISLPSPKRSAGSGLRMKLMLRLVVTAIGDRPQPAHDQQIEAEIGQPDQGRARDRAAGPQMLLLGRQAHANGGVVEMLDPEVEMGGLREVLFQEPVQLLGRHRRHDAPPPLP